MKRLLDLTADDLVRVPVWRYSGTSDETAVVEATERRELRDDENDTFIAHTQFALANGAQFAGFCTPAHGEGPDTLQPVILSPAGPVYFSFAVPPTPEFLASQWQRLGVGVAEIFPVHFRCTIAVGGAFVTGIIEAEDLTAPA